MDWWQYLLLVNIYLVLFFGFYALLLRRETFFLLNRAYLVSATLLSFFIPLIQSDWVKGLFITQTVHYSIYGSGEVIIYPYQPIEKVPFTIGQLLTVFYLAGVLFLVIRLVWQLVSLKRIISQPALAAPYSFFKKIKLDKQAKGSDVIKTHEQVHAKQWHSADVMIMEAVMIINWFNPVVYFYRYAVKHIHEFIADSYALKAGTDKTDYALLLLSQTFDAHPHQLVNNFFNHSLLKQRIVMLQKNKSQRIMLAKYGLSAPLFILMLILSSATVNNSAAVKGVNKIAKKVFELPASNFIVPNNTPAKIISKPADKQPIAISAVKKEIKHTTKAVIEESTTDTIPGSINGPVYTKVETEPSFVVPGTFPQFLSHNIKYPDAMLLHKAQGQVIVTFIVEKDGTLSNLKLLKDPGYGAGSEVLRVMARSPKWNPGMQDNSPVRVSYTLPISFNLNERMRGFSISTISDTSKKSVIVYGKGNKFGPAPKPLFVIDGKVMPADFDFNSVDQDNIASVHVILKDSISIAKYGNKGVNGVILVSMKKND